MASQATDGMEEIAIELEPTGLEEKRKDGLISNTLAGSKFL